MEATTDDDRFPVAAIEFDKISIADDPRDRPKSSAGKVRPIHNPTQLLTRVAVLVNMARSARDYVHQNMNILAFMHLPNFTMRTYRCIGILWFSAGFSIPLLVLCF